MYITTDVYTRDEFIEMEVLDTCRPGTPHLDVHGCPFLEACWMNWPMRCTTAEPHSVPIRACYHRLFCDWALAITSCVLCRAFSGTAGWTCEGRIPSFPGVSPSCSAARARTERGLLSQHVVGAQTETPRREAWGLTFLNVALTCSQDSRRVWRSWLPVG